MQKKLLERCLVENCQLPTTTYERLSDWLIKNNNKSIKITFEEIQGNRTLEQNKYYWELLSIVADEIGESKEDLHDCFKFQLLSEQKEIGHEVYLVTKSTTKLTKEKFIEYIDNCKNLIYEMFPEIKLPDYVL